LEETRASLPHLDARVLISLNTGVDIPDKIGINKGVSIIYCNIEIMGGLNACFLCEKEGHQKRDCPKIRRNNNNFKPEFKEKPKEKGHDKKRESQEIPSNINKEGPIKFDNRESLKGDTQNVVESNNMTEAMDEVANNLEGLKKKLDEIKNLSSDTQNLKLSVI